MKILQSMILKAVLPVWTHPQFTDCSDDFIASVISIIRHVFYGVGITSVSPPPNETTISTIVEMGFSRARAEEALRHVGLTVLSWQWSGCSHIQRKFKKMMNLLVH